MGLPTGEYVCRTRQLPKRLKIAVSITVPRQSMTVFVQQYKLLCLNVRRILCLRTTLTGNTRLCLSPQHWFFEALSQGSNAPLVDDDTKNQDSMQCSFPMGIVLCSIDVIGMTRYRTFTSQGNGTGLSLTVGHSKMMY